MRKWYDDALSGLKEDLSSEIRVNGLEFLEDFVLENRDEYFEDLELEDIDNYVSEQFDEFQNWLETEKAEFVRVGRNGKWYSVDSPKKSSSKLGEDFSFTTAELRLLELEAIALHPSKIKDFKELYQRLLSTNFNEFRFKCAFRLAKCSELSREISENEVIQHWLDASEEASKASLLEESCDCKVKAAYYSMRISDHENAAKLYEQAYELIERLEYSNKMQLLKSSRIQYQLFDNHEAASRIFVKEKELEYSEAKKSKKIALFLYRVSSNYGESPGTVLWNCLFILTVTSFITFFMGITAKGDDELTVWSQVASSIYYSIVTFTTLGYGDFYPKTETGQLFASLIALLGLVYSSLFIVTVVRRYSRT